MAPVRVDPDRLVRFFPALLGLTLLASVLEGAASLLLHVSLLSRASISAAVFALAVLITGYQLRAGRPLRARIALAISLTLFGALGTLLIPGVGQATALLPVVSFILVLPQTSRSWLITVSGVTIASTVLILAMQAAAGRDPSADDVVVTVFQDAILVGVVILVLIGLADFAMESRDALRDLRESSKRQLRVATSRLSLVATLRLVRRRSTAEATADPIATALADLPLVDVAVILEVTDQGLCVLASAGEEGHPIAVAGVMPATRAEYLLSRSRGGAWAELWEDRPGPELDDDEMTELGVQGEAFAPIMADDEIVGLVGIATTDREQAHHLVADVPSVSEAASHAGTILAPMIVARQQLRTAELRIAETIASGGFRMVFQPIIELATGSAVGFEALTRFTSGDAPEEVFAEAVEAGLGGDLEAATLSAAIRDAAQLPAGAWLALNISPTFLADSRRLISILKPRTRPITLEITEHDVIDDYGPIHAAMAALGSDVRLAVDDAGAGVANFQHLAELRPALVKIDRGLITGIDANLSRQAVIVGLVHFAAVSGAFILAEGIETQGEQEMVQRLGVTLGQGFHLGRPAPARSWRHIPAYPTPFDRPNVVPIRKLAPPPEWTGTAHG